jgi:GNAT superfamily N-acetyltransferase
MQIQIREYTPPDRAALEDAITYLQEYERALEPLEKVPGTEIAPIFLDRLLVENARAHGKLFIATDNTNGNILGFCNAWVETQLEEEQLVHKKWLYISDLAVLPEYQGAGVGTLLISTAEDYAKELQLQRVQLGVLAKSSRSREFYLKCGYREFEITLLKEV